MDCADTDTAASWSDPLVSSWPESRAWKNTKIGDLARSEKFFYDIDNPAATVGVPLTILVARIAMLSVTYTGLSWVVGEISGGSAFTGIVFTTAESEKATNHPMRR